MKIMGGIFSYTEMGKAMDHVAKVARDLIKARRESGHTETVSIIFYSSWLWILHFTQVLIIMEYFSISDMGSVVARRYTF